MERGHTTVTAFEIVRDSVDIVDAARRYGIEVSRHKKALCPFHDDHTPSLSFKGQRFKCFGIGCEASGDVIDLVGRLTNLSPLDTVRELNDTYHLRIDVDKPVSSEEVIRRKRLAENKRAFAEWEKWAHNTMAEYFRALRDWREAYVPRSPDDEFHPKFLESLHKLDYIEYLLDAVFIVGGETERIEFYNKFRPMVEQLARRMDKGREIDAGGIEPRDNPSGIVFPFELAGVRSSKLAA
jgi:hypothetical protein